MLALLPRGVQLGQLRANAPTFEAPEGGDSIFYDRVASGSPVPARAYFHSPLYRWFVSGCYRVFGRDLLALRLFQLLIGALGAALAALLARRLFASELTAAVAGGLVALCGPLVFYEGQLLPAALLPTLVVVCALAIERWARLRSAGSAGLVGLSLAAAALTRPTVLLWLPALLLWAWRQGGLRWRSEGMLVATLLLAIAPVTARNYLVERDLVLISANAGLNLYIGNNDNARGSYNLPAGLWFEPGDPEDDFAGRHAAAHALGRPAASLRSSQVSRWWAGRALAWIGEHPGRALALVGRKLLLWLNNAETPQLVNIRGYREVASVLAVLPGAGALLAPAWVGLLALLWLRERPSTTLYCWCSALYLLAFLPFFVVGRYRAPWLALVAPAAAWALIRVASELAGSSSTKRKLGVALALAAAISLCALPLIRATRAPQLLAFAKAAAARGDHREATRWRRALLAEARRRHWSRPPAAAALARTLLARGELVGAETVLRRELETHPRSSLLLLAQAKLRRQQKMLPAAEEALRQAIAADPGALAAWIALGEVCLARGKPAQARAALRSAALLAASDAAARRRIYDLQRRLH